LVIGQKISTKEISLFNAKKDSFTQNEIPLLALKKGENLIFQKYFVMFHPQKTSTTLKLCNCFQVEPHSP